jgi:hypothetical protein
MTVFDVQNTAFLREIAPLMMMWIAVGRFDDIWASYVTQRIMCDLGYTVHFGRPFVWHERTHQSLWKNLRDEIYGMEHTPRFIHDLNEAELGGGSVLDRLRALYEHLGKCEYIPKESIELGVAWCADYERVAR